MANEQRIVYQRGRPGASVERVGHLSGLPGPASGHMGTCRVRSEGRFKDPVVIVVPFCWFRQRHLACATAPHAGEARERGGRWSG